MTHVGPEGCVEIAMPVSLSELTILFKRPCGLMDKALVCGANDCRFESCQGQVMTRRPVNPGGRQVASREKTPLRWMGAPATRPQVVPTRFSHALSHTVPRGPPSLMHAWRVLGQAFWEPCLYSRQLDPEAPQEINRGDRNHRLHDRGPRGCIGRRRPVAIINNSLIVNR